MSTPFYLMNNGLATGSGKQLEMASFWRAMATVLHIPISGGLLHISRGKIKEMAEHLSLGTLTDFALGVNTGIAGPLVCIWKATYKLKSITYT
ncbi:hypothetical protein KL928_004292 [Ogataea angusta]|uniref:Uncharacterized protein n=1 Tax=Pichia angusta TaxID=870730 RepID=A0AAN6I4J2_PICAN|nr:uncharacterized protein KL928_004292 [Ogataea angusta]KAG7816828.1 hypothetical protein KL928_004292 [Ogataea angusta]